VIYMGKVKIPDLPELPELPLLDENEIGQRIGNAFTTIGRKAGKRAGRAIGNNVELVVGVVNDILELPRDLTKK